MKWDKIEGNWKEFEGKIKEHWGKLTHDDLTAVKGKYEQLIGKLQKAYGYEKDEAEKEVKVFMERMETKVKDQKNKHVS